MNRMFRLSGGARLAAAMVAIACAAPLLAAAQAYPVRPVRLIVPFPPGGSNDIVGRLVGAGLSERLGKPVVVDNRPGAALMLAAAAVATAPADGYTLLVSTSSAKSAPWTMRAISTSAASSESRSCTKVSKEQRPSESLCE